MSRPYQTTTQDAVFIPEIIANQALGRLGAYLQLGKTVTKDSELTTQRVGQVINVPKRGAIVANSKAQGSEVTVQQPSATDVQVTLDQHWEFTMGEEDFTRSMQQGGSVLPGYVQDGVIALAEKIEASLAGLYASFSFSRQAANPITYSDIADVRSDMVGRNVPRLERKFLYLHNTAVAELFKQAVFTDPKTIPALQALQDGAAGRVLEFDIFEGQLVAQVGSPPNYENLAYTRNAMVLATRPQDLPDSSLGVQSANVIDENGIALRLIRSYDSRQLAVVVTLDVVFGSAVLDDRQGMVVKTK